MKKVLLCVSSERNEKGMNFIMIKMTLSKKEEIDLRGINFSGKRKITDVALALGLLAIGYDEEQSEERCGTYWTDDLVGRIGDKDFVSVIDEEGILNRLSPNITSIGVCPDVWFYSIKELDELVNGKLEDYNGLTCTEGLKKGTVYVPTDAVEREKQAELSNLLKIKQLNLIDSVKFPAYPNRHRVFDEHFTQSKYDYYSYYEHENQLYLLLKVNPANGFTMFNNGVSHEKGDNIFIKVEPIDLLVNPQKGRASFDKILFSGVPICETDVLPDGKNVDDLPMGQYLDEYCKQLVNLQKEVGRLKHEEIEELQGELKGLLGKRTKLNNAIKEGASSLQIEVE